MYLIIDEFGEITYCVDDHIIEEYKQQVEDGYIIVIDINDSAKPREWYDGEWNEIEKVNNESN